MTKNSRALGCLVLFALPFAAGGLLVGFLVVRQLWLWIEVHAWEERPAKILHTELLTHRGDETTTFEVVARYEYTWDGETYVGERVALSSGSDNIGSFHQQKHEELAALQASGRPLICRVDPDDPTRAILYPEMRWLQLALLSVFSLVFTGAGTGLMGVGLWGRRRLDEDERLRQSHPEEPWRWKSEWAEARIRASGRAQFVFPGIFALFWNLVSLPLVLLIPREVIDNDNHLALIGLIFPLVGIGLFIWAGRALVRWRKFGDSVFEMSAFPGVIGGPLTGRVLTSVDLEPAEGFRLTLSCLHRVTSGSGKSRSSRETILWQRERRLPPLPPDYYPNRTEIPVQFAIPFDSQPTEERSSDDRVLWRLEVQAAVPGVDYSAQFEVPVFKTAASRPDFEHDESELEALEVVADSEAEMARQGIRFETLATGGKRISFAAARHKGVAALVTFFLMIWLGSNWLLVHLDAPLFFPILWGLFSLLILFGALDLWFERRKIEVHPDRLGLAGGLFGLGGRREIPRAEIREIRPVAGMQSGDKLFYQIQVETLDGKKHTAATKLGSLSVARQIIERLVER